MEASYEPNTQGRYIVPPEIKKWNWGAFFLSWIWGLAHNTYIALLVFVPVFGLFVPFILGFKGSEWAWRNREWQSVEAFQERQKKWAGAGLIFTVTILVFVIAITSAIFLSLANIEPVDKALIIANNNTEAIYYLGKPIEKGYLVTGSVNIEGPSGHADLSIPVRGSKTKGVLYIQAKKEMGAWVIDKLVLEVGERQQRINLMQNVI